MRQISTRSASAPNCYRWPFREDASPAPQTLRRLYDHGFPGCHFSPAAVEDLLIDPSIRVRTFSEAAPHLRDLHKARPCAPLFLSREKYDPGAFGQEPQRTGDCVAHGTRSAIDTTRSIEIDIRQEPEVYYKRGAIEPTYGARGHAGAGMDPARASRFVVEFGFLFREKYEGLGIDLTNYDAALSAGWGASGVPEPVQQRCHDHPVGEWIFPESGEEALDLLVAGYAAHSGQQVGFSERPDSRGIHIPLGKWNHDMATVGCDLSKKIWPAEVVFVVNSWGAWNTQPGCWPRDLWGAPIAGMIVSDLDVWIRYFVGDRSMFFFADVQGMPAKELPDWGGSEVFG